MVGKGYDITTDEGVQRFINLLNSDGVKGYIDDEIYLWVNKSTMKEGLEKELLLDIVKKETKAPIIEILELEELRTLVRGINIVKSMS